MVEFEQGGNSRVEIGGSRHFQANPARAYAWDCPACGTKNVTPFEGGCPSCGVGTPQQLAAAQRPPEEGIPWAQMQEVAVADKDVAPDYWLGLPGLSLRARMSLAVALAFWAENGDPAPQLLSRAQATRWARFLLQSLEE